MTTLTETKDIPPEMFNVKYEKTYPLTLVIKEHSHPSKPNVYTIEIIVVLPYDYPDTEYKKDKVFPKVAYLLTHYDTTKKNLEIDLFYVYNMKEEYKKLISKSETFNTKGLGKYMLCSAVSYLSKKPWFDTQNSTATLTASGGECFYETLVATYTFEECMSILKAYPGMLYEFATIHYNPELRTKLNLIGKLSTYYEKNKETVDKAVYEILDQNKENPELLTTMRRWVCEIKTNRDLVEKNYKKYGFEVTYDGGLHAEMKGPVRSIQSQCRLGRKRKSRKRARKSKSKK